MVALSAYLRSIGFKAELVTALDNEGISDTEDLKELDDDDVDSLFKVIKNPGGQIPNPAYVAPAAAATRAGAAAPAAAVYIPPFLLASGIKVPYLCMKKMKELVFYMKYLVTVQRTFNSAVATRAELKRVFQVKPLMEGKDEVKGPGKIENIIRIRDSVDDITACLEQKKGSLGTPLAYVIRKSEWLDATATPPTLPDGVFQSIGAEQIERQSLQGDAFHLDNAKVWDVIKEVFGKTAQWAWIMGYRKEKNGRGAFKSIMAHYLGDGATGIIVSDATSMLETLKFDGTKRGYSFDKFTSEIVKCYNSISTHDPGTTFSEVTRVRKFCQAVTSPPLQIAVAQVMSNPKWGLEESINFVTMFIHDNKLKLGSSGREISAFQGRGRGRGRGGRGRGGRGGRGRGPATLEDRYYPFKEYQTLTKDQKEKLREMQAKRKETDDTGDRPRKVKIVESNNETYTFEVDIPKVIAAAQSQEITLADKPKKQSSHYMRVSKKDE